jgi:hypothetical protein
MVCPFVPFGTVGRIERRMRSTTAGVTLRTMDSTSGGITMRATGNHRSAWWRA